MMLLVNYFSMVSQELINLKARKYIKENLNQLGKVDTYNKNQLNYNK